MAEAAKIAELESTVASLQATVTSLLYAFGNATADRSTTEAPTANLKGSIDTFYLLYCGALVFFMQAGFGVLEAGSVRIKNTRNILLKNLLDACVGAFIWWAWGHGTAYPHGVQVHHDDGDSNPFIGLPGRAHGAVGWVGADESPYGSDFAAWWFQYVFAAAAATIVSGAMAERAQLGAYIVYTTVITGLIYPVIVHWVWDEAGWASAVNERAYLGGVIDFAGSGVVHMTGGVAAFWGALIIGPRTGRFDAEGKPVSIRGHSSVLQAFGTFMLWFGWYGFNPGSTLAITPAGAARIAARATVCTTLSAAFSGMTVVLITKRLDHVWDLGALCNGILAGLVSINASCATVLPWHAALIGGAGGFVYTGGARLELRLKVDDPLDAFAVHGCCGFWACIATGLFSVPEYAWGAGGGLFYGEYRQLAITMLVLVAEISWTSALAGTMFLLLKTAKMLRITNAVEDVGMDLCKTGGSAYSFEGNGDPSLADHRRHPTPHGVRCGAHSAHASVAVAVVPPDTAPGSVEMGMPASNGSANQSNGTGSSRGGGSPCRSRYAPS